MQDDSSTHPSEGKSLLGNDDPSPVVVINREGRSPFLLIGDHAGNAIPKRLGTLGLSAEDSARHIAWDIGVSAFGQALAKRLDAAFIHQSYSRLVIDCNRDPERDDAIPNNSDGTRIPGNIDLAPGERARRIAEIHEPYQRAIATEIARREEVGRDTLLVALHSFTPRMAGIERPWQIGVLHDGMDDRFARALLNILQTSAQFVVGDNEPYRMDDTDHTVPRHVVPTDLAYVEIEMAQSEISSERGIACWTERLASSCLEALTAASAC